LRIGPFRGLSSYLEEDANLFFGREAERQALKSHVLDPQAAITLVVGETGAGKTSLLRAGLLPQLLHTEWIPLYLECGPQWRQDLGAALTKTLGRPVNLDQPMVDPLAEVIAGPRAPAERHAGPRAPGGALREEAACGMEQRQSGEKRFLLALDHLEQLLWLEPQDSEQIVALIDRVHTDGGKLVLVVDRGNVHALDRLSHLGRIPEGQRIHVGRMDRQIAAKVMEQTVLAGGGYMEAGLPELIAEEVAAEGPVLPAALQVVGHAALLAGATRTRRFSRAGGGQALAALYVERLVARAGGWRARRVLAMLTEQTNPREGLYLATIAQGAGLAPEVTRATLEALEREGLVVSRADPLSINREPSYALIHPYLLQSVRDTVAPVLRGRAQARLSLRRRIHERGVLRPDEMLRVWRYLGLSMSAPEKEQVKRALRVWSLIAGGLVALPLVLFLVIWGVLASSSFVDTATSQQGVRQVVVRTGRPSLSFAFNMTSAPYGQALVETGLVFSSLPPALQRQVVEGELVGDRDEEGKPGLIPYWLHGLWEPLPPVRRGALQLLAGAKAGTQLLQHAASSAATRRRATWALALLSGDSPATQTALLACIKDQRPEVRRMAVAEAMRLGAKRALVVLSLAIRDSDNQIRLAACKALRELPASQTLALLGQGLADADLRVQQEALDQLRGASKKHPVEVFEVVRKAQAGRLSSRFETVDSALEQLLVGVEQKAPQKVAAHLMRLVEVSTDSATRVEALGRLRGLAGHLDAARVLTVVGRLVNSKNPQVRAAAIPLHARFGNPGEVEEQLTRLSYTVGTPRKEAVLMRRAAAAGLGLLQNRPGPDRLKLLKRLLADPDVSVRAAAVQSLVKIGAPGLREVLNGIKQGHRDVGLVALRTVCQDAAPDRRVATSILAAAWKAKRADLRGRALGCARKLAAANPRLSLWLGDQARLDKNPEVRRAAADAVALAVKRYGGRVDVLTRSYLRQADPTITVALLDAMTEMRLPPTEWLFREVSRLREHRDAKVRASTAALLAMVAPSPDRAAVALETLFADKDEEVVRAATAAAKHLKPGPEVKRLDGPLGRVVAQARSKDAIAALGLARRLGLTGPIRRAAVHPEPDVRAAAVSLLARRSGPKQALEVLESALRDPEQALRLAALDAIARESGRLGQPAVGLLVRSAGATSPAERWAAFEALGRVKGKGAVEAAVKVLRKVARDRSEERRRLAFRSLGALAPKAKEAAQALVEGALDSAVDVRTEAQAVLAEYLGRHSSVQELVDLLISSERSALQRHLACSALAWSGRIHGVASLKRALSGKVGPDSPIVIRMSSNLAQALARRQDRPEEVAGWLFGW